MTTSKSTGKQKWTISTPLFPQTMRMECSEAKWQDCRFSDNWNKSGRFFKRDSVCMYFAAIQKHTVLKRTNLWMQERYHAKIKFHVQQKIQAKLWNMVYCSECYVIIRMAIFVKWKFIPLKGKAEDVILYQWKSETETLTVAEQLLQHCKDRGCWDPLQQDNYSWRIKDQLDITCYFISLLMYLTCFRH